LNRKLDTKQLKSNTYHIPFSPFFEKNGKTVEIDLLDCLYHAKNAAQLLSPELESCMKKIRGRFEEPKTVTFAEKLIVNEESLDSSMIDRMKHNLEYNDDRIFANLSIFQHEDIEEDSKIEGNPEQAQPQNDNVSSIEQYPNGDSGNRDFIDVEQNQGILSRCEESGGINDSIKEETKTKDPIFEAQVSVIERKEDDKEFDMANDLESIYFDKSGNQENSSGFIKLNDSLIKCREVWKDKSVRKESYRQVQSNDGKFKKESDSFLGRADSDNADVSQNFKALNSLEDGKVFLESRPKSFKDNPQFSSNLNEDKDTSNQPGFDPEVPSEDFFEEKDSESIIERNDDDSKFVDEESYSMVYLTKQQNSNNAKNSMKISIGGVFETNTKELSKIEDTEHSKDSKISESMNKSGFSKDKIQSSINSISNINSPYFKFDYTIEASEIKDTKKIINNLKIDDHSL
jgi:hypothetical protein